MSKENNEGVKRKIFLGLFLYEKVQHIVNEWYRT